MAKYCIARVISTIKRQLQYDIIPIAAGEVNYKNTKNSIFIGDDYTFIGGDCTFIGDGYTFIGDEYSLESVACMLPALRV